MLRVGVCPAIQATLLAHCPPRSKVSLASAPTFLVPEKTEQTARSAPALALLVPSATSPSPPEPPADSTSNPVAAVLKKFSHPVAALVNELSAENNYSPQAVA